MFDKATSKRAGVLASLTIAAMATATLTIAAPAMAQETDFHYIIDLADRQRMLSQRVAKEIVLVALDYNTRENIRNLEQSHEKFEQTLNGLRHGDLELALEPATDPAVIERLAGVEEIWELFASTVEVALEGRGVSRGQVSAVSDLSLPLLDAANNVVISYEELSKEGNLYSMLVVAVNKAGAQRTLSQRMSKEFFLIALGVDPERNRQMLRQSIEEFDRIHLGLVNGDIDLLLLPAPTRQIQAQLRSVGHLWEDLRPAFEAAAQGGTIDEDAISLVASLNLSLLNEMNSAVSMYTNL